jgi:hypothetical protein
MRKVLLKKALHAWKKNTKILSKTIAPFGLTLQLLLRQPKTLMSQIPMVVKDAIKLM